ncbi:MAG: hypothetical protein Q9M35_10870 [Rhodothermus sp.]|nr:hypothetical protein [Rhodothermus sp.]
MIARAIARESVVATDLPSSVSVTRGGKHLITPTRYLFIDLTELWFIEVNE